MTRILRKASALLLAVAMCATMCIFASAYSFSMSRIGGHTVATGVEYNKYSVTSGENGNTKDCTMFTFNPDDGYIPMAFSGYSGTSATLATQYSIAVNKYGYDVVGVVNGSFFSMDSGSTTYGNYGTLNGILISNGKIASAHIGRSGSVVAFSSDGSMNIVDSALKYTVNINNSSYPDMLYYINKTSGSKVAGNWSERFYYYDTSCGSKCDTYAVCPGTEILCRKLDNSDIAVGRTLVGEVISVTENTYGGSLASDTNLEADTFVLFMKAGSSYQSYITGLAAGDKIEIETEETIAASKQVMENANSVIENVGWLVRDGVDRTRIDDSIGTHSVTLQARWTAFGTKSDGSYVFFTSEGAGTGSAGSITLRDVAAAMIDMGCINVIRMDGGGSSAMYLKNAGSGSAGYVQASSRAVGDCILVVKRSSVQKAALSTALATSVSEAQATFDATGLNTISEMITEAQAVASSATSVSGDYKREIMKLSGVTSGKGLMSYAISTADELNVSEYSDYSLDKIETLCREGKRMAANNLYTDADLRSFALSLIQSISEKNPGGKNIALGAAYGTGTVNASYPDTGKRELTDGVLYSANANDSSWTAFHSGGKVGTDGLGSYTEIMVDLGSVCEVTAASLTAADYASWGISSPVNVVAYASQDGVDYFKFGELRGTAFAAGDTDMKALFYSATSSAASARYVVFRVYFVSNHLFIGEVGVYGSNKTSGISVDGINSSVTTDSVKIYTTAHGAVTAANSNMTWSHGFICSPSGLGNSYKIDSIVYPAGDTSYSYTIPSGGLLIAMHGAAYAGAATTAAAGDNIFVTGIDFARSSLEPTARITFGNIDVTPVTRVNINVTTIKSTIGFSLDENGFLNVYFGGVTPTQIKGIFTDSRAVVSGTKCGTGSVINLFETNEVYTICVRGDLSGDGSTTAIDYLIAKRAYLESYTLSAAQTNAGCLINGETLTVTDYTRIKRHVLGTFNIYLT